jgi:hypothetical protein
MISLYEAHSGGRAWKDIGDRLQAPYYRSRGDYFWKIRVRTNVGKFSFVNRTISDWTWLPEGKIGNFPVQTHIFRKRVKKVIIR